MNPTDAGSHHIHIFEYKILFLSLYIFSVNFHIEIYTIAYQAPLLKYHILFFQEKTAVLFLQFCYKNKDYEEIQKKNHIKLKYFQYI